MVAQHASTQRSGPHPPRPPAAQVGHLHARGACRAADVAGGDRRCCSGGCGPQRRAGPAARSPPAPSTTSSAVPPGTAPGTRPRTSRRAMEALPSGKWKLSGAAGRRVARRRVAHPRRRAGREPEAAEAREAEGPDVERADRVGADAPLAVAHRLEERERPGIGAGDAEQVVPVAHAREARLLLVRGQARQVVDRRLVQADDVVAHPLRERRVRAAPRAQGRWPTPVAKWSAPKVSRSKKIPRPQPCRA